MAADACILPLANILVPGALACPCQPQIDIQASHVRAYLCVQALVKYREVLAAHPDDAECLGALAQICSSLGAFPANLQVP